MRHGFEEYVEGRFDRLELFLTLMIRGYRLMTDALQRLTASVGALTAQVDANDTELATLAQEIRDHAANSDDSDALNALADKLDASRGNLKTAADAAADALTAHTADNGGEASTPASGAGDDSVSGGGEGGDQVSGGGEGGDQVSG